MSSGKLQSEIRKIILPIILTFLVCALIIMLVNEQTENIVKENAREYELRVIKKMMTNSHDNVDFNNYLVIDDFPSYTERQTVTVYQVKKNTGYIGVVFKPVLARGYSGSIELAVGIASDGTVMGVEVDSHQETGSLGGQIERQNSEWLNVFNGVALSNMHPGDWATRSEGGKFDEISGATITSRGIINAIHQTLEYHQTYHAKLYEK